MAISFKITIPSGELYEHLKGRDPKSRNFELVRLATNALSMTYQPTKLEPHPDEVTKAQVKNIDNTSPKRVSNKTAVSKSEPDYREEQLDLEISDDEGGTDNFVDFGDDILSV